MDYVGKSTAAYGFLFLVVYLVYRVLNLVWFRPKKLEKILRKQGLKGNDYRLLLGDKYENGKLIKLALSKPIKIDDDIRERTIPHILKTIKTHGKNSFMWNGWMPKVTITDPRLIREVLTKYSKFHKNAHAQDPIIKFFWTGIFILEGDSWANRRRIINPAFHVEKLKLNMLRMPLGEFALFAIIAFSSIMLFDYPCRQLFVGYQTVASLISMFVSPLFIIVRSSHCSHGYKICITMGDGLTLMLPAFYSSCRDLVIRWEKILPKGGSAEVNVWHDFERLSGDVLSKTLFGSSYEEGRRIFELIKELTVLSVQVMQSVYIPGRRFLPSKRNRRIWAIDKEVNVRMTDIINRKMKAMEERESSNNDFLGLLLECNAHETQQQQEGKVKSSGMSIEDIIGECRLFYFAGQDTASTLLVWTMVLLSRFPEWQAKAREEVFQVFGDKTPDYNGINSLKIITMILYEVLRLYPPVIEISKVAQEDTQLGNLFIPAGAHVMLSQMLLHYDPEIWGDDAMEFKPQRFAEGVVKATKIQGSFFPFGLGPRICIGQNFALLEAKMALALILQRFSFVLSPSYVHAPFTLITMQPQHGAHLILHKL